jgi:hypothetical protein
MTLTFNYDVNANPNAFIDLSQVASLVNRRFYRQGINWAVAGFKVLTTGTGQIQISKLPNTWVMSNSWEKSFRAWQRMNNEALAESESLRPKFLDFKIYADANHHQLGFDANLLPVSSGLGVFTPGEWESSKLVIPNSGPPFTTGSVAGFELVAVGANNPGASAATGFDAKSLIEGYAASRALPDVVDPNVPLDADDYDENWMLALFNDGTRQDAEVVIDMTTENNIAPYPFEGSPGIIDTHYPNGANQGPGLQIHDVELVTATTIGGTTRLKGGNFPCGLVNIASTIQGQITLQIDLVPGNHRGYLCEPMTEM